MISTNRGNFLLQKILLHRYPNLFLEVEERKLLAEYLSVEETARSELLTQHKVEETLQTLINSSLEDWDGQYPCKLGEKIHTREVKQQLVLFLVSSKL